MTHPRENSLLWMVVALGALISQPGAFESVLGAVKSPTTSYLEAVDLHWFVGILRYLQHESQKNCQDHVEPSKLLYNTENKLISKKLQL
jgi:hypothetical protein